MTNDELADHFKVGFDELHAKIDAADESPRQEVFRVLANVAHRALDKLREKAAIDGIIVPQSGGGPK